jgi:hypothetical protein
VRLNCCGTVRRRWSCISFQFPSHCRPHPRRSPHRRHRRLSSHHQSHQLRFPFSAKTIDTSLVAFSAGDIADAYSAISGGTQPQFLSPPISVLPTSWHKVLCCECQKYLHDISYRHCTECHFKEMDICPTSIKYNYIHIYYVYMNEV